MHFTKVTILRDETAKVLVHVGAWEIPVLELKHGQERIEVGELVEFPNRDWPADARSEMQRLGSLYGTKGAGDDALTYAERAYGEGSAGVKALQRAMDEAREAAEGSKKAKRGRPSKAAQDLVGAASA